MRDVTRHHSWQDVIAYFQTTTYGQVKDTMAALDTFHPVVKQALIKDGWTITEDP